MFRVLKCQNNITPGLRNYYEGYRGLEEPSKSKYKLLLKKEERIRKEEQLVDPHRYIRNLFGEEWHIQIKVKVSSNNAYIKYKSNGDTHFKVISLRNYLKKMREHIIDTIKKLKCTSSSWKI